MTNHNTDNSPAPSPAPSPTADVSAPPAYVDTDAVLAHIEVPFEGVPNDVRQINAVLSDPDTGRTVRRMVVYDAAERRVRETEIGLVGEREVYVDEHDTIRYLDAGLVYVRPIQEAVKLEDYVEGYCFDEARWRLGAGFEEQLRAANGIAPWAAKPA